MNLINAAWLKTAPPQALTFSLLEYRYLVRRFPQWLALTIGRSEHERVRRLLLPNLTEELGGCGNEPSHLMLLDKTIESCAITGANEHSTTDTTRKIEAWFFSVFSEQPVYNALCVLGPGTEAISSEFLDPLEEGLKCAFSSRSLDLEYFAVHRTEMEAQHTEYIDHAIRFLEEITPEQKRPSLAKEHGRWSNMGIEAHNLFWKHLKRAIQVNSSEDSYQNPTNRLVKRKNAHSVVEVVVLPSMRSKAPKGLRSQV